MTEEQTRQYADIMARVSVRDGHVLAMEVRTTGPLWDMRADMAMPLEVDDGAVIEWLYGQFDQVLAEFRRLARRGQFCRGSESEAGNA